MKFIEITGQPCTGKTSIIKNGKLGKTSYLSYSQGTLIKIVNFFRGLFYLDFARLRMLFVWSFDEEASVFFKLNIFRNAVSKFGVYSYLSKKNTYISSFPLVDEGISHLPFLFLNTKTDHILNLIRKELETIQVIILKSPGLDVIKDRLKNRGHKRLRFLSLDTFIEMNCKIESLLMRRYSELCQGIKIIEND